MTSLTLNAEFCVRLSYCLLHSLWAGSALTLFAVVITSPSNLPPKWRYRVLLIAELVIFIFLPASYLYLDRRESSAQANMPNLQLQARPAPLVETIKPSSGQAMIWSSAAEHNTASYSDYVATIYLAGVTIMLLRVAVGLHGARRLVRASRPITEIKVLKTISRAVDAMRFNYTPAIAYCGSISIPCVVSVLRPMLLLPFVVATELTPQQLEVLVMHELAHIRRQDHIVHLVQRMVEAFLFFHPAIWFLSRRISVERELCCDDLVIEAGRNSELYARSLVRIMELGASDPITNVALIRLAATGDWLQFRHRVLRLVSHTPAHTARLKNAGALLASMGIAVLSLSSVGSGMLRFQHQATQKNSLMGKIDLHLKSGWSRLQTVAAYGTPDELDALLANHEDPNATNDLGQTSLQVAEAAHRRDNARRLLLHSNVNIDHQDNDGRTALHYALGMAPSLPEFTNDDTDEERALDLLNCNARINIPDRNGICALQASVIGRRHVSLAAILKRNGKVDGRDNFGRTAIHYAAMIADPNAIASLRAQHADVNALDANGWSPLDMLGLTMRVDRKVDRATIIACRDLLLGAGAKPDLSAAVALNLNEFVAQALDQNPDLANALPAKTVNGNRLAHWAAGMAGAEMCDMLAKHYHVDFSVTNDLGQNALHIALRRRPADPQVTASILNANVSIDAPDKFGSTPCHYVAAGESLENAELIVARHPNLNARDQSGFTPLHILTQTKTTPEKIRIAIARCFLNARANVNAVNNRGEAPLHLAVWEQLDEFIALYRSSGADLTLKDNTGRTAYLIASNIYGPNSVILKSLTPPDAVSSTGDTTNVSSSSSDKSH